MLTNYAFKKKYRATISRYIGLIIIMLLGLLTLYLSYSPGKRIIGWDNHQSELNLPLNLERSLSAAWTDWAGVGMNKGMAMEAELPKQLLSLILSVFIPNSAVRYFYVGLMYILGPVGMWFLLKYLNIKDSNKTSTEYTSIFLGSLFYLFNIHTVQIFRIPLEMFIAFYAGLPWMTLTLFRFIDKNKLSRYFTLLLVNFIFSTAFITPTNFIMYCLVIAILGIGYLYHCNKKNTVKRVRNLIIGGVGVLISNLYWLSAFLFFFVKGKKTVLNSKISELISENFTRQMQGYGTLHNFIMMKNFYFDWNDLSNEGLIPIMGIWKEHLNIEYIIILSYLIFLIIVIGIIYSLYKRSSLAISFFILFLICFVMYMISNPPTGLVYDLIIKKSHLLSEVFRSPYTKLSVPLIFSLSFFIFMGSKALKQKFAKVFRTNYFRYLIFVFITVSILVINSPAIEGELFFSEVQLNLPEEYFEFADYMNDKDDTKRIIILPAESYAGWRYYDWGYRGSGFIWYAIKQPVIDRAFDVWSEYNETLYNEISLSISNRDIYVFNKILQKYNISYIMLDKNLKENSEVLEDFLNNNNEWSVENSFGDIVLYKSIHSNPNLVLYDSYYNILPSSSYLSIDRALYDNKLPYISSENIELDKYYLFRNLERNPKLNLNQGLDQISIQDNVPSVTGQIDLSGYYNEGLQFSVNLDDQQNLNLTFQPSTLILNKEEYKLGNSFNKNLKINKEAEYLRINDYNPLNINHIDERFSFLHQPQESVEIYTYDNSSKLPVLRQKDILKNDLMIPCINNVNSSYKKDNKLLYEYSEGPICEYLKLPSYSYDVMLKILFTYETNSDFSFDYCINTDSKDCLNAKPNIRQGRHTISDNISLKENMKYYFTLNLYPDKDGEIRDVFIDNLKFEFYKPTGSHRLNVDSVIKEYGLINLRDLNNYSFNIPKYRDINSLYFNEKISREEINVLNKSDDTKLIKNITRNSIKYTALDGKFHDVVSLEDLKTGRGYLICPQTTKIENRSLKFYLRNNFSNHNVIEKWTEGCFVKFGEDSNGTDNGYTLYLEGESYNQYDPLDIELESVDIYGIPYDFLKNLTVEIVKSESIGISNSIEEVKTYGSGIKKIKLNNVPANGLLVDNHGFDEHWILLSKGNLISPVLVNNWATGWILNEVSNEIYLIFIPQLFQWLSYLIFIESLAICLVKIYIKKVKMII